MFTDPSLKYLRDKWIGYKEGLETEKRHNLKFQEGRMDVVSSFIRDIDKIMGEDKRQIVKENVTSKTDEIIDELTYMGTCILFKDKGTHKVLILPQDMCKLVFTTGEGIEVPILQGGYRDSPISDNGVGDLKNLSEFRDQLKKAYLDNPAVRDSIDTLTFNALENVPGIKKILGPKALTAIRDFYLIGESFIIKGETGYGLIDQDSVKVLRVVADCPVYQTTTQKGDFINPLIRHLKRGSQYESRGSSIIALKQDGAFDRFMDIKMDDPHVIQEIREAWESLSIN